MKYTKVEVLKDIPGFKAGIYDLNKDGDLLNPPTRCRLYAMELYPEWFRLISEPEFKVGGYAKCVKSRRPGIDFTEGKIYQLAPGTDNTYIRVVADDEGEENGIFVNHFTPATEAEYLAQEEAKKPWRPKDKQFYYWINEEYKIGSTTFLYGFAEDRARIKSGNVFKSYEAAEYFRDNYLKPAFEKYAADYPNISSENK